MRYIKSVLICVISALVFCLSLLSAQAADNFMEIDGFVFGIQQGNAVIHGYNGGQVLQNMVRSKLKHPRIQSKLLSLNPGQTRILLKKM